MLSRPFLLALSLLSAVAAQRVEASSPSVRNYYNYCTPGAFATCASVQIFARPQPFGTALTIRIQNLQGTIPQDRSGGWSVYRMDFSLPCNDPKCAHEMAVYDGYIPFRTLGPATSTGKYPDGWDAFLVGNVVDVPRTDNWLIPWVARRGIMGCTALRHGYEAYYQTCGEGACVEMTFKFEGHFEAQDVNFSWTSIGDRNSIGGVCEFYEGTRVRGCSQVTVTPEPVSLTLLATGLAGVAGIRRRRKG